LMVKQPLSSIANSYAIISFSYVVGLFLILFGFFWVAVSQSPRIYTKSVESSHSTLQNF
jgi:preprotein translocase subunit SecY